MASLDNKSFLQNIDLRSLAEMQETERAYLSLYASSQESLNRLEQRAERIRNLLSEEPDELAYFERNLSLIRTWLDENGYAKGFRGEGLCVFACEVLDYVRGIPLAVAPEKGAVQDTLRVGAAPYLRPLAELQDEYENFLVVAADNRATRIIQIASAKAETVDSVRGDIKNHVRKGGWSQQRYARRRDKELRHYAKEINNVLSTLVRNQAIERIVLLGSQETLNELEDVLTPEVAACVIGKESAQLQDAREDLVEEAYTLFFEEERDEEERLWQRIKAEYLSDGLAVTGASDVLDALKLGRVEEVLITRDVQIDGARCRSCENVFHGTPTSCLVCGAKDIFKIDLVNEFVRQAELTSAAVEFSDALDGLVREGNVAALLRY